MQPATIAGKPITIKYGAPSVRGRQIFGDGGLVSKDWAYPVWRAGANSATAFHTDAALDTRAIPESYLFLREVGRAAPDQREPAGLQPIAKLVRCAELSSLGNELAAAQLDVRDLHARSAVPDPGERQRKTSADLVSTRKQQARDSAGAA